MTKLLELKGLKTHFHTEEGVIHAVNGVSLSLNNGETLGIVGESGCGKSVTMTSLLRLIPMPPGRIVAGEAFFNGKDLLKVSNSEIRSVRGSQIGMIFQDPMTFLIRLFQLVARYLNHWRSTAAFLAKKHSNVPPKCSAWLVYQVQKTGLMTIRINFPVECANVP